MKAVFAKGQSESRLVCLECGNARRFMEVMAKEARVVDGNLNYVRLFEAITDVSSVV